MIFFFSYDVAVKSMAQYESMSIISVLISSLKLASFLRNFNSTFPLPNPLHNGYQSAPKYFDSN